MSLYSSVEYCDLVNRLLADRSWHPKCDRLSWMRHVVCEHERALSEYGALTAAQCVQYERMHRKSASTAALHRHQVNALIRTFRGQQSLTESQLAQLITLSDNALRYSPIVWNDWSGSMCAVLQLYVDRAAVFESADRVAEAMSDLRHAQSVVECVQCCQQMREHFRANDPGLLIAMVTTQIKVLQKVLSADSEQTTVGAEESVKGDEEGKEAKQIAGVRNDQLPSSDELQITSVEDVDRWLQLSADIDREFDRHLSKVVNNGGEENDHDNDGLGPHESYRASDRVRLDGDGTGGRTLYATDHIAARDHVLSERTVSGVIFGGHTLRYCNHCLCAVVTLWPCSECIEVAYCSAQCAQHAHHQYHRFECGLYGLLLGEDNYYSLVHTFRWLVTFGPALTVHCEQTRDQVDQNRAIQAYLDLDRIRATPLTTLQTSPDDRQVVCTAMTSLWSHRNSREPVREHSHSVLARALVQCLVHRHVVDGAVLEHKQQLSELMEHLAVIMLRVCTNGFCWTAERRDPTGVNTVVKVASCVGVVASMVNHSCHPNTLWNIDAGGVIRLTALRSIEPNTPLTISYGPRWFQALADRQIRLTGDYCFHCRCEACIRDAANADDTLRCPVPHCDGPLTTVKGFEACLHCGYEEKDRSVVDQCIQVARHSADAFFRTVCKLHQKPSFLRQLWHRFSGKRHNSGRRKPKMIEPEFCVNKESNGTSVLTFPNPLFPIDRAQITAERVAKLEKHFVRYASVVYGSSYLLLEQSALLLKVYHDAGLEGRGLRLLTHIDHCLDSVFPDLFGSDLIRVLYSLDYVATFLHDLLTVHDRGERLAELMAVATGVSRDSLDWYEVRATIRSLVERVNVTIEAVLHHDLTAVSGGQFMPELHRRYTAELDTTDADSDSDSDHNNAVLQLVRAQAAIPDADERYFRAMYTEAQQRLDQLEQTRFALKDTDDNQSQSLPV